MFLKIKYQEVTRQFLFIYTFVLRYFSSRPPLSINMKYDIKFVISLRDVVEAATLRPHGGDVAAGV